MPQFGTFTRNPDTGVLTGSVAFAAARIEHIEVAPNVTRRGEKSPDYQVFGPTGGRFGSGWNKLSREGRAYIQLVIGNDPTFLDGLEIWPALIETETKDEFAFVWEKPDASRARPQPNGQASAERPAPGVKA